MPVVPPEIFHDAIDDVVRHNAEFVPPHQNEFKNKKFQKLVSTSTVKYLKLPPKSIIFTQKQVPPHQYGGALYVRPFIFGSGPVLGLQRNISWENRTAEIAKCGHINIYMVLKYLKFLVKLQCFLSYVTHLHSLGILNPTRSAARE